LKEGAFIKLVECRKGRGQGRVGIEGISVAVDVLISLSIFEELAVKH
jgi:hypothetical protein